jgi:hypothetical protein
MKKFFKTLGLGLVASAFAASSAFAADGMNLAGVNFATDDVFSVGALILVGCAAIWGIRKVIGLAGR